MIRIADFVAGWPASPYAAVEVPWPAVRDIAAHVRRHLAALDDTFVRTGDVAVHRSATIEEGAIVKGPAVIGPGCFVAAGAYLRGGIHLERDCIVGPNAELKSSYMFPGAKLAHLNFVGDSIIGAGVNIEAGAIVANYRNELDDKAIRIAFAGGVVETGVDKFGALLGDGVRIGANAVIAPGAILRPGAKVPRLALVDQHPQAGVTV